MPAKFKVDLELVMYVLKFHHVPDHIIQLIQSFYTDYCISIATDEYLTLPTTVEKEVLQGDSSPLLFNLVINTLINTIKQEKLNCIRYIFDACIPPKHYNLQMILELPPPSKVTTNIVSTHSENDHHGQV